MSSASTDITNRIQITSQQFLGHGVRANLRLGTLRKESGESEQVAIKTLAGGEISPGLEYANAARKMLEEASKVWIQINHPNLAPFYGIALGLAYMPSLVLPYYPNGNVNIYLARKFSGKDGTERLKSPELLTLSSEIARGIKYLHDLNPPLIHGDIRGANIFIDDGGHARIADYGLLLALPEGGMDHVYAVKPAGIIRWTAPELLNQTTLEDEYSPPSGHTKETDIYAYGMTILEIYTGVPPFSQLISDGEAVRPQAPTDHAALMLLAEGIRPPLGKYLESHKFLGTLIQRCWDASPSHRPPASEICEIFSTELANEDFAQPGLRVLMGVWFRRFVLRPWMHVWRLFITGYRMLQRPFW